jgi:sugar phosphate isomerase/epimerase
MPAMHFSLCNEIFAGWTLEDAFRRVAAIGYDAVEIAPFTVAQHVTDIGDVERRRIRDLANRNGLVIAGIHWVLVKTEGMHLTHPDAATRARTAGYFVDLVRFCADLGGKSVIVGSPKQREVLPGLEFEQAWNWATECFRDAVKCAEDRGVTICFEPLSPVETNFINSAAEGIRFARQFDSRAMKVILDVKAMCAEPKPIPQIIRESAEDFAYFHANDRNLKGPGFGEVDFVPIATALREVGYDGTVSVEVFKFEEGPEVIASQSLECLKAAFSGRL